MTVDRAPGLSVRLKLTLSYAGFLMVAGVLLLAVVWVFLLRYVPDRDRPRAVRTQPLRSRPRLRPEGGPGAGVPARVRPPGRVDARRAMLAPLTRIRHATRLAANGSLSHRIHLEGRKDEFRELADAFDAMLARLEADVAEQQRFAANASHELRTPLAVTQTLLDVARNDPHRDTGELVERLHAVNTRAIALTEALLLLSRADQRSFTREHVDLSLISEEATETLLPFAEERGLTIETSGDVTPTTGSHALLLQMTTNLVHNAIVHNLPERGTVWVTTSAHPRTVLLTVENTGEKLSPQLVSTIVEPFQRGTGRIRDGHAGVGLGLAIVKSIIRAHDGKLTLTPRPAGGLCVAVRLAGSDTRPGRPAPEGDGPLPCRQVRSALRLANWMKPTARATAMTMATPTPRPWRVLSARAMPVATAPKASPPASAAWQGSSGARHEPGMGDVLHAHLRSRLRTDAVAVHVALDCCGDAGGDPAGDQGRAGADERGGRGQRHGGDVARLDPVERQAPRAAVPPAPAVVVSDLVDLGSGRLQVLAGA